MTRMFLKRVNPPTWVRLVLSSWQFWVTVCILGAMWAGVLGFKALEKIAKDEHASQKAQYAACVLSIPEFRKFALHVEGVNEFATVIVRNSVVLTKATPPGSLHHARVITTKRIADAARKIHATRTVPVPTREQCLEQSLHPPSLPPEAR